MASADRSVGVRNGAAALWFSSLANLDFTGAPHVLAAAIWWGTYDCASNVPGRPWFHARKPASEAMIRIRYIMEYFDIWPYCREFCSEFRREIAADGGQAAPETNPPRGSHSSKIGLGFGASLGRENGSGAGARSAGRGLVGDLNAHAVVCRLDMWRQPLAQL